MQSHMPFLHLLKDVTPFLVYDLFRKIKPLNMCLYLWKILPHFLVYDLFRKIKPLNMCLYLWKILPHFLVYDLFRKGHVKRACQLYYRIACLFLLSHAPICMSRQNIQRCCYINWVCICQRCFHKNQGNVFYQKILP